MVKPMNTLERTYLEIPDLLQIQKDPYEAFLQRDIPADQRKPVGIEGLFRRFFPMESPDKTLLLEYLHYNIEDPIETEFECMQKGITYGGRFKVSFSLSKRTKGGLEPDGGPKVQEVYLGLLPFMTARGTFIINGVERTVVNQIQRSPGVYFKEEQWGQQTLYSARIHSSRGLWLDFLVDQHNCFVVIIGRKKISGTTFLKALGYSREDIETLLYGSEPMPKDGILQTTLAKDDTESAEQAIMRIYMELKPGYSALPKEAHSYFQNLFFTPKEYDLSPAGRAQVNKKLGSLSTEMYLTSEDIEKTVQYLFRLIEKHQGETDDIDHLGNKRVRTSAELVLEHMQEGLKRLDEYVRQRMPIIDKSGEVTPQNILNSRIFSTVLDEFFARNQLSQFLDQTNPLSELTHKRRLTAVGEGGVKERKRAGFEVRDVHYTHFGRMCPIETPEGANIGLINSITVYAKTDELGFLRTPYLRVKKGRICFDEVEYLSADEEDTYYIAPPDVAVDPKTFMLPKTVRIREKGEKLSEVSRDEIDFIGASPKQMLSISASLIPFLEHDDSNRALMGSNMQRQAVPLLRPQPPLVKTGMEQYVIRDSGVVVKANYAGRVSYVDSTKVVVEREEKGVFPWEEEDTYFLQNFRRTNQNTCFHQKPVVSLNDMVQPGSILADGPAVSNSGELALGRNLLVAFMPWYGHNYEDAIILSERLAKEDHFTSIHIEVFDCTAQETELGAEEITSDLPNVTEEEVRNLDSEGIVRIGAEVKPYDILVGKITPKGESELTPEEKLLRVIFGEKARDVANTSLTVPPGISGVVVNVRKYYPSDKVSEEDLLKEIAEVEKTHSAKRKIIKKVIIEKIKEIAVQQDYPTRTLTQNENKWETFAASLPAGAAQRQIEKLVRIGLDELAKVEKEAKNEETKIRKGTELEANAICKVVVEIAIKRKVSVGDKMSGRHGNKGVVSTILPEEDLPFLADGTTVDIILNPLGVPSRMNVGQILETHLGWALQVLGRDIETPVFESIEEMRIQQLLKEAGLPEDGKAVLYDGKTGESFFQPVTVGYTYMMKLSHIADEKAHARSVGSYSLVTQQPLGGRAQFGGQRFGEMEVWALEGYGAAHVLKEMLTVKSDDMKGRKKIYESIVKGLDYNENNIPESFHVLTKEMNGLGFDLKVNRAGELSSESDRVTIRIAPPAVVRSWSYGEVKKAETLNYNSFRPERDGLFCERIFGPVRDWECYCGKYKKQRYRGVICDRCNVEVTTSDVRRERMGHIELAAPVSYIWLFKSAANWLGSMLGMTQNALEMVLYYERYIVIDPMDTPLQEKDLLSEDDYRQNLEKYGSKFKAGIGAEAIQELLKKIELEKEAEKVKEALKKEKRKDYSKRKTLVKKLRMIEGLIKTQVKPEYLITSIIPVIPPDLRPLLPLDGGKFVASDLNDLYQRVINRNNRLKKLIRLQAPDMIIRNEKRMLQESVDALFDNGRHGQAILGRGNIGKGKRPLKSLSEALRGKQGRFRQNLLGKRVDYSGRAVIVVGSHLKLHECGLPKQMALELFSPFVLRELRKKEYFHTLGSAKRALEENRPEVWEILEKVTKNHPVMLNRQPTLHRLSIQAFEPRLIEGNVIKIHPLVCPAFNADFDGDTMSVHVPLTVEARLEADLLMKANHHILSPANGRPIVTPTRDIVLGSYYLTFMSDAEEYPSMLSSFDEAKLLYWLNRIDLHQPVRVYNGKELLLTTVGRILFSEILPSDMPFQNQLVDFEALEEIVKKSFKEKGYEETVTFLDEVKEMGFYYSTFGGLSIGIEDLKIPETKPQIVAEGMKEVARIDQEYKSGLISEGERYNRIIDLWTSITNEISGLVFSTLRKDQSIEPFRINSLVMMVESGARGNKSQVTQLAGMRGLMSRPTKKVTGSLGEIIETPIVSSFREGLPVLEYFISIHGGRKGLVDTALKTSDAGYLSRRLVDVAHSVIITEEDCGTEDGFVMSSLIEGEKTIIPFEERIVGRVAVDQVTDIVSDEVLVKKGEVIDEDAAKKMVDAGFERIRVRSVFTCKSEKGLCAKCYGTELARKKLVNIGESVGVVAAQSIGEPGTQLTLRTFHLGGTATRSIGSSRILARSEGIVKYSSLRTVLNKSGKKVVLSREGEIFIYDDKGRELDKQVVLMGTVVHVEDGAKVKKGDFLASWDPYALSIIAEKSGTIEFKDIVDGKTVREDYDSITKLTKRVVVEHRDEFEPQLIVRDEQGKMVGDYYLSVGANILVSEGQTVDSGDIVAKIPRTIGRVQDITGGLPRVSELFEVRTPKNPAILSEIEGEIEILSAERGGGRIIKVKGEASEKSYTIPFGKHILVATGDRVISGSKLTDGPVVLADILNIQGEKKVQEYLLNEIQKVYRIEGVSLNDKHIEIIVKQMLSKVRVDNPGDTYLLEGEEVDKVQIMATNESLSRGKKRATYKPLILGITRIALGSNSFISACSFQETIKVLTNAAVTGQEDFLAGLKENVILGRVIPAGTGVFTAKKTGSEEISIPLETTAQPLI